MTARAALVAQAQARAHVPAQSHATVARLGLGCSSLGSEIGYRQGCRLIEAAFAQGFRHFDLAPPYGQGQAERIVGDVLASVRSQVTLVSKAGIAHPRGSALVRLARHLALPLKRAAPGLWTRAARSARQASASMGQFDVDAVRRSLDESLRRLRTDHLDALLLHEVQPGDVSAALAEQLRSWRDAGRVRAIGSAGSVPASQLLAQRVDGLFDWIQTNHYWGAFVPGLRASRRLVTHRAIRTGAAVLGSPQFATMLADNGTPALQHALASADSRPLLLLRAALQQVGPGGQVLVSTLKVERLPGLWMAAKSDPEPGMTAALNALLLQSVARIPDPDLITDLL